MSINWKGSSPLYLANLEASIGWRVYHANFSSSRNIAPPIPKYSRTAQNKLGTVSTYLST